MRKIGTFLCVIIGLVLVFPVVTFASEINYRNSDLKFIEENEFEQLIMEIENLKAIYPESSDEMIIEIMNNRYWEKGITDIWNSLTETEKRLCIRYPLDALKVNTAKNIATSQTEKRFGINGLGDRSDAFRHGMWNAEMTILIGEEKAELFATAHEDKDVTGNEIDGYLKMAHRNMDLHNNEAGRYIGKENKKASEDELAGIIYQDIYSNTTSFIWLHE